jgi:hypothetical protein
MLVPDIELEPVSFQAIAVGITFNSYHRQSQMVLCISRALNATVMFAGLYL